MMVNRIYYFVIPYSLEYDVQIAIEKLFTSPLKCTDKESSCFNKRDETEGYFYTFLPQDKIEMIIDKLKTQKVLFAYKNITQEVLMGVQNNNSDFVKTFTNKRHKQ